MPTVNKQNAETDQEGPGFHEWSSRVAEYTVNIVELTEAMDLAPLLKGLPGDLCHCPHWGYMIAGTQTVTYADGHEETFGPGDAFYFTPGHTPRASAGASFVVFSPSDLLAVSEEAMQRNMAAMQSA
jgi:hypothetical protein